MNSGVLLKTEGLSKTYIQVSPITRVKRQVEAVKDVNLSISYNSIYGLIGETGHGKSTLGRMALLLETPTSGKVFFNGIELTSLSRQELRKLRPQFQMIFQSPDAALNPRHRVRDLIGYPLRFQLGFTRQQVKRTVQEILEKVHLDARYADSYPHQLSGGEVQRVEIARALSLGPRFLVADEPASSLDASVRGKILNLLLKLKDEHSLTVLFIGHNLRIMESVCDRISVIYKGSIIETIAAEKIRSSACHPYTRALFGHIKLETFNVETGAVEISKTTHEEDTSSGCPFSNHCPFVRVKCVMNMPELKEFGESEVRCHFPEELL